MPETMRFMWIVLALYNLCAGLDMLISSLEFQPRLPGPYGTSKEPASGGSASDGQAKGRRLPRAESGLGSFTGPAAGSKCRE
jgi:hypothetical protein